MNNDSCGIRWSGVVAGVVLTFAGILAPGLSGAAGVAIEVSDCLALDDNFARLACYDAKARAAARLEPVRMPVAAPAPAVAPTPAAAPIIAPAAAPAAVPAATPASTLVEVDPVLGVPVRQGPEPSVVRKGTPQGTAATSDFGKAEPQVKEGKRGKTELHDRIASLASNGEGGWSVTLASGQVWRQNGSRRYNLRVGQEVRIYPSGWGDSYRLSVEELGSFIPVDRAR